MRGQLVSCRASTTCVGGQGDDVGVAVDGRGCCLDNPRALAFVPNQGTCVACVGELTCVMPGTDDKIVL